MSTIKKKNKVQRNREESLRTYEKVKWQFQHHLKSKKVRKREHTGVLNFLKLPYNERSESNLFVQSQRALVELFPHKRTTNDQPKCISERRTIFKWINHYECNKPSSTSSFYVFVFYVRVLYKFQIQFTLFLIFSFLTPIFLKKNFFWRVICYAIKEYYGIRKKQHFVIEILNV